MSNPEASIEKVTLWVDLHRPHRKGNSMSGPPTGPIEKVRNSMDGSRTGPIEKVTLWVDLPQAP